MDILDIIALAGISWLVFDFIDGCIEGYRKKRKELNDGNKNQ